MPKLPPETLLHRLDLAIRQRVHGDVGGDTKAFGVSGGMEVDRVRPWTPGDDWRFLDAAATARTGTPHVRVPVAERRFTLWLAFDVSSSMAFGTQQWEKGELAVSVAAALGLLALRQSGKVGAIALGGDSLPVPPRPGRPALLSLLESLTPARDGAAADLGADLGRLDRVVRDRAVVAVISDFRADGAGYEAPLRRLCARHEVLPIVVSDPREAELPDVGVATFVDPETGRRFTIDTKSAKLRRRFAERAAREAAERDALIRGCGAEPIHLSTDADWLTTLVEHLENRRRRRWASTSRSGS